VQSATSDLWSGFRSGKSSSLTASAGEARAPAAELGRQIAVGAALLLVGAVALLGGLGVAGSRRRRARSTALDRR
jgi:hypothetical protein